MPNWVTCKCMVSGPDAERKRFMDAGYFKKDKWGDGVMDFNMVIPEPNTQEECPGQYVLCNDEERRISGMLAGSGDDKPWFNWYRWRINNWGTKWTGEVVSWPKDEGEAVKFAINTAWSFPEGIAEKLTVLYPELEFSWEYADEDVGQNCGFATGYRGTLAVMSREGDVKFACGVLGYDYDEYMKEREDDDGNG